MADERDPVDDAEFVLRRIHCNHYDADMAFPVLRTAFRPTKDDATGLSVFREKLLTHPTDALATIAPAKRGNYYLARLPVRELRILGLTIVPEPDPAGPAGHAVLAEINWPASKHKGQKRQLNALQQELAKLASAGIVHRPA